MLKTIPYYFYQVDAIESWLDEQAQKGLFPLKTHFGSAMSFRKDTPHAVRYRIDVKRKIGYTDEKARIAAYREMGWECAWYAADAEPYGGQLLVLQDGKEVWCIGYDGGQRLTDALDVFARA